MKNLVLRERKNQRQLGKENINIKFMKIGKDLSFFFHKKFGTFSKTIDTKTTCEERLE